MKDEAVLSQSILRVKQFLESQNVSFELRYYSESTRTAQEAADVLGCQVSQIVKSLIFKIVEDGTPLLALVSGSNRLDEKKVSTYLGRKIIKADADFVREKSGYAIGGVPPVAHASHMHILMDQDLLKYKILWAAAGTPHGVFSITPNELAQLTEGEVADIVVAV